MLAIETSYGFGSFGADAPAPSTPVAPTPFPNIVMPVVPDNTVVRCKFDPEINGLRCSPVELLEPPTIFLLAAAGLAALTIGYAFGRIQFLSRFAERVAETPLRARMRRRR
jgi:hypothetical protein